jgi:hypothetical protein
MSKVLRVRLSVAFGLAGPMLGVTRVSPDYDWLFSAAGAVLLLLSYLLGRGLSHHDGDAG